MKTFLLVNKSTDILVQKAGANDEHSNRPQRNTTIVVGTRKRGDDEMGDVVVE